MVFDVMPGIELGPVGEPFCPATAGAHYGAQLGRILNFLEPKGAIAGPALELV